MGGRLDGDLSRKGNLMTLRPAAYRDRVIDATVTRLLGAVGAVSVEGPKWCGKTWTSLNHANSVFYVADPAGGFANRELARLDLLSALQGAAPHAIDEWQEVPGIWDAVRFGVDMSPGPGQYLLTGSSTPADDAVAHSGTGRIARVRMRPMTELESGHSTGEISLAQLMDGLAPRAARGAATLGDVSEAVTRGGWPANLGLSADQAAELASSYLDSVASADLAQVGGAQRNPAKVMALLRSLARNTATTVGSTALERDIAEASGPGLAPNTIREYLILLERLYLLEQIPAWRPALRSPVKLRQAPKRMLVDPSLAVAGLQASPDTLRRDPKTLGFLFEAMVLRDLLVFAQGLRASVWHYRDNAGLEVDAIVTLPSGAWAAIEIKLGHAQVDEAARTLLRLRRKMADAGDPVPAAMIVVVGVGGVAQRRPDGVCVVPVDLLGP